LLVRVVVFLIRPLRVLVRGAVEGLSLARGTPLLGVVVLLVLGLLVLFLIRRRRRQRKGKSEQ
jgi:uncharacterized membrane protein